MPRYVILLHEIPPGNCVGSDRGTHWDLMLETGDRLRTWALERPPAAGETIAASQLADHRVAYLDYEGPVSGNRGLVSRWDGGTYEIARETADELHLWLRGERGLASAILQRDAAAGDHFWTVSFSAAPISG